MPLADRLGVCADRLGVCADRLGVCADRLGVCADRLGACARVCSHPIACDDDALKVFPFSRPGIYFMRL